MLNFKETARKVRENASEYPIFAGLDGFVDEILHVVEKRFGNNATDFQRFEKISDYGEKIVQAAGLSTNFEMFPVQVKLGGNGPIFSNAMLKLGMRVTYCGKIGYPDIHPVFRPMAEHPRCTAISRWNPAHTDALEFLDGKLLIGKMSVVYEITWESVKEALGGVAAIAEHVKNSALVGMLNWTMLPFMDDILEGILDEALPLIRFDENKPRPYFFFDIADPGKRTDADIRKFLDIMNRLEKEFRVILGLNEKESRRVAAILSIADAEEIEYEKLAREIFARLGIHCLVIHPTTCAFAVTKEGYFYTEGPYCVNPVLTTGGGDNFNAGFCLGMLCGLGAEAAVKTGVSASGFYVRNGRSASIEELTNFMETL